MIYDNTTLQKARELFFNGPTGDGWPIKYYSLSAFNSLMENATVLCCEKEEYTAKDNFNIVFVTAKNEVVSINTWDIYDDPDEPEATIEVTYVGKVEM